MATVLLVFATWTLDAVSGVPCTGVEMYSYTLIFMYCWSNVHAKVYGVPSIAVVDQRRGRSIAPPP